MLQFLTCSGKVACIGKGIYIHALFARTTLLHSPYCLLFILQDETLFYMFYSMPGDEAQLIAADELCGRGWMYHKRWKVWMAAAPNTAPTKGPRGERGSYNVWDINVSHLRMGSPYCSFLVLVWHLLLVEALAGCSWRTICAETVTLLCQHIHVHAVRDGQVHPSCRPTQELPPLRSACHVLLRGLCGSGSQCHTCMCASLCADMGGEPPIRH